MGGGVGRLVNYDERMFHFWVACSCCLEDKSKELYRKSVDLNGRTHRAHRQQIDENYNNKVRKDSSRQLVQFMPKLAVANLHLAEIHPSLRKCHAYMKPGRTKPYYSTTHHVKLSCTSRQRTLTDEGIDVGCDGKGRGDCERRYLHHGQQMTKEVIMMK